MTRTAISPRLAMRTLVSTPYGYLRAGRTCQISAGRAARARGSRTCAGWPRPAPPTPTPWRWPAQGEPEGIVAGRRPPDRRPGPAPGAPGRRRRAPACCCRSCCGRRPRWSRPRHDGRRRVGGRGASRRWPGSRRGSSGPTTSCGPATARRPTASWPGSWPRPTGRPARDLGRLDAAGRARASRGRGRHRDQRGVAGRAARRAGRHRRGVQPRRRTRRSIARTCWSPCSTEPRPALRAAGRRRSPTPLLAEWRPRSATLGRRVRVDLGRDDVEGTAVDVTDEGHLVVETAGGRPPRRSPSATSSTSAEASEETGRDEARRAVLGVATPAPGRLRTRR